MLMLAKVSPGMFGGAPAAAVSSVNAVLFDGANDRLQRDATLSTSGDTRYGLASFWVYRVSGITNVLNRSSGNFALSVGSTGGVGITLANADNSSILILSTATGVVPAGVWSHVLFSWDTATRTGRCYVDGSAQTVTASVNVGSGSFTPDLTGGASWHIGSAGASQLFNGSFAEIWVALDQTQDISNSTLREKYRSAAGLPVALGSAGATATGVSPQVYLKSPAATYGTNSGTGGNFTVIGSLEDTVGPV